MIFGLVVFPMPWSRQGKTEDFFDKFKAGPRTYNLAFLRCCSTIASGNTRFPTCKDTIIRQTMVSEQWLQGRCLEQLRDNFGDFFSGCIVQGISGIHANSDDFPWKDPQRSIIIITNGRNTRIMMDFCGFFSRKVVRIRMNSRNSLYNAPAKETSK